MSAAQLAFDFDRLALAAAETALDRPYTPEASAALDRAVVAFERPGATPAAPWGRRPYDVQGRAYPSLEALAAAVAERRRAYPPDVEYDDPMIAEVVNTMHPDVKRRGYQAIRFRDTSWKFQPAPVRAQLQGAPCFMGFFVPLVRWQDVTTYPWRRPSPAVELKQALRTKFAKLVRPTPPDRAACAGCGVVGADVEYDHIAPTFDAIAAQCLAQMTEEERTTRFGYDKFAPDTLSVADFLPDDHPAVLTLVAAHRDNVWQWLCGPCHRQKTGADARQRASCPLPAALEASAR